MAQVKNLIIKLPYTDLTTAFGLADRNPRKERKYELIVTKNKIRLPMIKTD